MYPNREAKRDLVLRSISLTKALYFMRSSVVRFPSCFLRSWLNTMYLPEECILYIILPVCRNVSLRQFIAKPSQIQILLIQLSATLLAKGTMAG
jgi:hypothetical protein